MESKNVKLIRDNDTANIHTALLLDVKNRFV